MNKAILDLYTDFLIVNQGLAAATILSKSLEGSISHDKISRFLREEDLSSKELWGAVKATIRQIEEENGAIIFDDCIDEKPYTDENEIVCWHFNHAKQRMVKGINILTGLIAYSSAILPIIYEVIRKEDKVQERTKNELMRDMLEQCQRMHIKYSWVLADVWYSSQENMEFIFKHLKKHFIFGLKSNRLISLSKEEKSQGIFRPISSLEKENLPLVGYLKGMDFPVKVIKRVFKNEDGSTGILYLATSDVSLNEDRILKIYQKRWKIEEYHKSLKSNLGIEKSPTRIERTQKNHIFAALMAFFKLESLKIKSHLNHFALKYKLIVSANIAAMKELKLMKEQFNFA